MVYIIDVVPVQEITITRERNAIHIDKNATLVNVPHKDCDLEESKKYVDAMQAMIDDIFQKIHDELPEGKYQDYHDSHQNESYDWFMAGENDLYPVAAWFYDQEFT